MHKAKVVEKQLTVPHSTEEAQTSHPQRADWRAQKYSIIVNTWGVMLYHLSNWKTTTWPMCTWFHRSSNKNGWDWNEILPNHGTSSPYIFWQGSLSMTQQDMSRYLWTWHNTRCFTYLFYFYLISSVWYPHQELVGTNIEAKLVCFLKPQQY